jgi:hypothetical protein
MSKELIVVSAERIAFPDPLPESKKTSSDAVGTALFPVQPVHVAQLVGPVAAQSSDDPPPTQLRPGKIQPEFPETESELYPAYQVAPPVAAESLIDIQSTETVPLALESVAALPATVDHSLARLPVDPLVVKLPVTVCVVPLVRRRPVANPAVLTAKSLNVFDPVTVMLLPEKMMLL